MSGVNLREKRVFSLLLGSTFACLAYTGNAQTSDQPVSLPEVINLVVSSNPDIQVAWRELDLARKDLKINQAEFKPQVDLTLSSAYLDRNYTLDSSYPLHRGELSVSQLLYDGFTTHHNIKEFEQVQLVRYYEMIGTAEGVALSTTQAYLDILLYRELFDIAVENLRTHISVFKQIEESVEAGVARRADLEQINGRLSLAESNVITEQSNLHDVSARFLRVTGLSPDTPLTDYSFSDQIVMLPDFQSVLFQAYETNPSFNAALYNISALNHNMESAEGAYHPRVELVGSYNSQSRNDAGLNTTITEGRVGINVNWNLYRGGADKQNIKRSLVQVDQAKSNRDRVCRDMRQSLQIAYNEINSVGRQLPSLNEHKLSSDRVNTAYFDQFNIGERTLLDLLDSENELYEAKRAYSEAVYTQQKAYAELLANQGKLMFALGVAKETLPSANELTDEIVNYDPNYICPADPINSAADQSDILVNDVDGDGVTDLWDDCNNTPLGAEIDINGCEVKAAPPELAVLEVTDDNVIEKVTVNLPFLADSADIQSGFESSLQPLVDQLTSSDTVGVVIHGHASLEGNANYNQKLSERRAMSVAAYLMSATGLDSTRITAMGYGESQPLIDEISEEANAKNRRIEAFVVSLDNSAGTE